jgi:hypothetical protein
MSQVMGACVIMSGLTVVLLPTLFPQSFASKSSTSVANHSSTDQPFFVFLFVLSVIPGVTTNLLYIIQN